MKATTYHFDSNATFKLYYLFNLVSVTFVSNVQSKCICYFYNYFVSNYDLRLCTSLMTKCLLFGRNEVLDGHLVVAAQSPDRHVVSELPVKHPLEAAARDPVEDTSSDVRCGNDVTEDGLETRWSAFSSSLVILLSVGNTKTFIHEYLSSVPVIRRSSIVGNDLNSWSGIDAHPVPLNVIDSRELA